MIVCVCAARVVPHTAQQDVMNALRNVKRPGSKTSPSSKKRKVGMLLLGGGKNTIGIISTLLYTPIHHRAMTKTWGSMREGKRSRPGGPEKRIGRPSNGCVQNPLEATWMVPTGTLLRASDVAACVAASTDGASVYASRNLLLCCLACDDHRLPVSVTYCCHAMQITGCDEKRV